MKTKNFLLTLALGLYVLCACGDNDEEPTPVTPPDNKTEQTDSTTNKPEQKDTSSVTPVVSDGSRFVGGDISLLPSYEANGAKYADKNGKAISNVLAFLKEQGWNAMRVRLFVDPSKASSQEKGQGVRQDLDYVIALGKRIKEAGLSLMLDFHYSDSWADPAKQWTPAAWLNQTDEQLYETIYKYTADCLRQMNEAGATPDFIQTGNEISYGMLWGAEGSKDYRCYMGSDANWTRFTSLLKQAGKACRDVCPNAKIIIHTERARQQDVLVNFYNQMKNYGVDYDIIGLSYYPYYHGPLTTLNASLTKLESTFAGKPIMIVETGHGYKYKMGDDDTGYELSNKGQQQFTADLIATLKKHEKVTGLFWWFPEANEFGLDWNTKRVTDSWYNAGLFDNATGKALDALYEMQNFK